MRRPEGRTRPSIGDIDFVGPAQDDRRRDTLFAPSQPCRSSLSGNRNGIIVAERALAAPWTGLTMFGFGKKKITPAGAATSFAHVCFEQSRKSYGLWVEDVVEAAEQFGGHGEYFQAKIDETSDADIAYVGAVMAIWLPFAKDVFGDETGQTIYRSLHRELSALPVGPAWFCDYVFGMVRGEEARRGLRGSVLLLHLAKRLGIEETPALMETLNHPFFQVAAIDNIALAPIGDYWRNLVTHCVIRA